MDIEKGRRTNTKKEDFCLKKPHTQILNCFNIGLLITYKIYNHYKMLNINSNHMIKSIGEVHIRIEVKILMLGKFFYNLITS